MKNLLFLAKKEEFLEFLWNDEFLDYCSFLLQQFLNCRFFELTIKNPRCQTCLRRCEVGRDPLDHLCLAGCRDRWCRCQAAQDCCREQESCRPVAPESGFLQRLLDAGVFGVSVTDKSNCCQLPKHCGTEVDLAHCSARRRVEAVAADAVVRCKTRRPMMSWAHLMVRSHAVGGSWCFDARRRALAADELFHNGRYSLLHWCPGSLRQALRPHSLGVEFLDNYCRMCSSLYRFVASRRTGRRVWVRTTYVPTWSCWLCRHVARMFDVPCQWALVAGLAVPELSKINKLLFEKFEF